VKKAVKTQKKPIIKKTSKLKVKKVVKPVKKPVAKKTAKSTVKKPIKPAVKKIIKPVIKKIEKPKTNVNPVQPQNPGLPSGDDKQPADHRRPLIVFPK
jgi:hypothetical protein